MRKRWIIWHPGPYRLMNRGIGWSYAERDGGPVLRYQTSWKKINGIWINTKWFGCWILFRRRLV